MTANALVTVLESTSISFEILLAIGSTADDIDLKIILLIGQYYIIML